MSENKENVPKIRFPGFSDAWEQRAISDLADRYDSLRVPITASDRVAGSTPYYGANGIQDYVDGFTHDGEFILIAEDGANDLQNYPVQYVNGKVWVNNHAHVLQAKENITDNKFLMNAIRNTNIEPFLVGGGRAKLNADVMMKIIFSVPELAEQVKIGDFFDTLDHHITHHERKLNNVKNLKAGLFQKMFPKNVEDFPEVRFPEFTDAWKQRKLGEIYTERKERGYDSLQILSVSIHHGVSNEELDSDTLGKKVRRSADKSLYKHVHFGDLVLNMMRAWQGAIGVVKSEGMVSPAYITAIPSAELYPLFMDYCLRRDEAIIQMNNLSYGVTDFRKRLYWDSFINVLCRIPSVPEQQRITIFFSNLDHLITLHQRKLKHLQEQKKALLQQMFV